MRVALILVLLGGAVLGLEPEFPLTGDSKVQAGVAKGTMVKGQYVAREGSVFPGTEREYQLYLPAGFDKTKPAAFMVFQDGVIYQAPIVFDNLIAKGDIPSLVGVFIKPGVVPAANENALPRFNRSYEYDSVTLVYSRFLIEEFLPAVEAEHGITFSTNPNEAAISGNSSGGICAFIVAWHRPDRFRRVFTGVGTYVGIHGADQLPVWVRKFEPKPLRVFLQSGTGDNNLYCGDWWMANQMMERSLTWAGYDVNHAWGEGGHNQKHASQIFPEVMRWLWREWKTEIEVKANVKGESKWRGYEVVGDGEWEVAAELGKVLTQEEVGRGVKHQRWAWEHLAAGREGVVYAPEQDSGTIVVLPVVGTPSILAKGFQGVKTMALNGAGEIVANLQKYVSSSTPEPRIARIKPDVGTVMERPGTSGGGLCIDAGGRTYVTAFSTIPGESATRSVPNFGEFMNGIAAVDGKGEFTRLSGYVLEFAPEWLALSPDQTLLYATSIGRSQILCWQVQPDGRLKHAELFGALDAEYGSEVQSRGLCVDTNGGLYVATSLGIQVLDQAGRVNFIIPTPKQVHDVCFGGKDLGELFIACGDTIYKRATKAKGVVSGQMAPIKPAPPKL
jgi:gluconolactonase